jgi:hypothetical protein
MFLQLTFFKTFLEDIMKIWLDDIRTPPDKSWTWIKTSQECLEVIGREQGEITEISFDHDLGEESLDTGYAVAKQIERWVHNATLSGPLKLGVHSANPVGRKNIEAAITSIDGVLRRRARNYAITQLEYTLSPKLPEAFREVRNIHCKVLDNAKSDAGDLAGFAADMGDLEFEMIKEIQQAFADIYDALAKS